MFERILVAVDPSDARRTALLTAGKMAQLTKAEVHVLHVVASTVTAGAVMVLEEENDGTAILDESLAELYELGVKADGRLVRGLTPEVPAFISAAAEDFKADLLIISPHHRSAVAAFFNPRVSDAVAHTSRIAVLLAPEEEAKP